MQRISRILLIPVALLLLPLLLPVNNSLYAQETAAAEENAELAPIITDAEYAVLDYALAQILMTRDDLGFKKDYVTDDYRLDIVQRHLDDPMLVPVECDAISREMLDHSGQTTFLLKRMAQLLDRGPTMPVNIAFHKPWEAVEFSDFLGEVGYASWDNIELGDDFVSDYGMALLENVLSELVAAYATAGERVAPAFNALDDDEMAFLAEHAPTELLEEMEDVEVEDEELDKGIGGDPYADINRLLEDTKSIDWRALYTAAMIATRATEDFSGQIQDLWTTYELGSFPAGVLYDGQTSAGRVVIGGFANNVYGASYNDCVLIIDFGGNDIYLCNAGYGNMLEDRPLSGVIDMGGDDLYISRADYSQGSGFFGIGILSDWTGDDTYYAGSFSQASGFFGAGILCDWVGEDNYVGDTMCQGAGAFGIGILCDGGSNDHYRAAYLSQGFGFTLGCGALIEGGGHDDYYAGGKYEDFPRWRGQSLSLSQGFGYGIRPVASGGIGILIDAGGNDFYSAEVYGQGVSYWFSLAILADFSGHDKYSATQYAQGSGIHLSVGCLIDRSGNDYYTSWACGQGGAHDLAVGWLIDHQGDDFYTCRDLGLGSGNANGVGILIDREGEDGYFAKAIDRAIGSAYPARDYGGVGVLIDMAGPDTYAEPLAGDGKVWTRTNWGVGVDVDEGMEFLATEKNPAK